MTWGDAWADHDTTQAEDWRDACPVQTVGWLVRDGKVVSVAAEVVPDGYRCVTHIPRPMVRKVERL